MRYNIKTHKEKPIDASAIKIIYDSEKWWPERNIDDINRMLVKNNDCVYGLWDNNNLIGFCRFVSDNFFRGYIEDFIIIKEYRSKGIGKYFLTNILEFNKNIHIISLFCNEKLNNFYKSIGFKCYDKQKVFHIESIKKDSNGL